MGDENTDKAWVIDTLVQAMTDIKESILELSKDLHGPIKSCPLGKGHDFSYHNDISRFLDDGISTWSCPFCGRKFEI